MLTLPVLIQERSTLLHVSISCTETGVKLHLCSSDLFLLAEPVAAAFCIALGHGSREVSYRQQLSVTAKHDITMTGCNGKCSCHSLYSHRSAVMGLL